MTVKRPIRSQVSHLLVALRRWLFTEFLGNTVLALVAVSFVVFIISILANFYTDGWLLNVLAEAHGMVLDILVLGVGVALLNKYSEKKQEIKRYSEEIDDFRLWKSDEAAYRVAGAVKRLNNLGVNNVNLSSCYLKGVQLVGARLQKAELGHTNFQGANLTQTDFREARCVLTNFQESFLTNAQFEQANFLNVDFEKAILTGANFVQAEINDTGFVQSWLVGANFKGAKIVESDFMEANLVHANFEGAIIDNCSFLGATIPISYNGGKPTANIFGAKSLTRTVLEPELKRIVEEHYPHLFDITL